MNCQTFCESMEAFLDGEADLVVRETMEPHAAKCETCRKKLGLARKARGLMQAYDVPNAPAGFAARTGKAAHAARVVSIWSGARWRAAAAAVFFAFGAGLGIYFLLNAEGSKDAGEAPVAERPASSGGESKVEELPPAREQIEVAQAPESKTATDTTGAVASEESAIAENLEILENWDLLNDPDVAIALSLPDEDFELLMSALEAGV